MKWSGRAIAAVLLLVTSARAQPSGAPPDPTRAEARERFEKGIALFEEGAWDAALAEFLKSRELFPTRVATKDAALCLRKLQRYDEALAMFEALLRDFPNAPAEDKLLAERQMAQLRALVGTIDLRGGEPGATLVIDNRVRGSLPVSGPIRVPAGTHALRVHKDGSLPFETQIDVAGGQTVVVVARLAPLTRAGRLRVVEESSRPIDVVVDGVVVGATPWEGALAPGRHLVVLRGDGDIGTEPVSSDVRLDELTTLKLRAEELASTLRIEALPRAAVLSIDGTPLGVGPWEGRLRPGPHRVEVMADGYFAKATTVTLLAGAREISAVRLERDPESAIWDLDPPARVVVEVAGGPVVVPASGGVADGCASGCTSTPPLGGLVLARGGYELGSGIGFHLDAGYLGFSSRVDGRSTPVNVPSTTTPVHDERTVHDLSVRSFVAGLGASLRRGRTLRWVVRVGAGIVLGAASDARTGRFRTVEGADPRLPAEYDVAQSASSAASWLYVAPEARLAFAVGDHLELSAGVAALLLKSIREPRWEPSPLEFPAGRDGAAYFNPDESLLGSTLVLVSPTLAARWAL